MSRISYSEEEDYQGQFALWDANCRRSMRGRAGQAALRELEAALTALPVKRLERDVFVVASGGVCALGALAVKRKMDAGLSRDQALHVCADMDPYESQEHGEALGLPSLVAWKVVAENDIVNERMVWVRHEGPNPLGCHAYEGYYRAGYDDTIDMTPELRYERMLTWLQAQLLPSPRQEAP